MNNIKYTCVVKHSNSKDAFNVINTKLGANRKVAVVPYVKEGGNLTMDEARQDAEFIAFCFNHFANASRLELLRSITTKAAH